MSPMRPQRSVPRTPERSRTLALARAIWQRVNRSNRHVAAHPYCMRKGIRHAAGAGRTIISSPRIGERIDCIAVTRS